MNCETEIRTQSPMYAGSGPPDWPKEPYPPKKDDDDKDKPAEPEKEPEDKPS